MTVPALRHPSPARRPQRGFTLIELMVTVAVVAILVRIALPSYVDYTKRGKLTEAFNQMTTCGIAMSQFYQDNRTYVGASTGAAAPPATCLSTTTNFKYDLSNLAGTTYTLTATATSSSLSGFAYTLDQDGKRVTTGVPSGWTAGTTCWTSSRSGCQQ